MSALKNIFTLDSFADGCAGAVGGTSAITVFYPLNIIRTKLQTDDPSKKAQSMLEVTQEIMKNEGIAGLYKGWWGQVVALGVSNYIYFYTYNMLKVIVQKKTLATITPIMNLSVGAAAGVVNVVLTTPLWMVSTQLMAQQSRPVSGIAPYSGVWDGLVRCYQEEGINGLWKGLAPNLMLVSNPVVHFFCYERIRIVMSQWAKTRRTPITSIEFFLMGAVCKMIATVVTYPIQVAQSQLRNDRADKDGKRKYSSTIDCLYKIYMAVGFEGWFRGMGAKLWQTVLTAAFQFMTYEKTRVLVFKALTGKDINASKSSKGGH